MLKATGHNQMDELLGFSVERVSRLTGLSVRQLRYWDETGVYFPQFADEDRRQLYSRLYSFRDVVGLRTLAQLRRIVPLQELRKIGAWLRSHYDAPWSTLRFSLKGRKVFFADPDTGVRLAARPSGQVVLPVIELEPIAEDMRTAVRHLRERDPQQIGKIARHRYVMSNAPVLAGTRIPTATIWSFHQAGYDTDAILHEYPQLTAQDVEAAIENEAHCRRKPTG